MTMVMHNTRDARPRAPGTRYYSIREVPVAASAVLLVFCMGRAVVFCGGLLNLHAYGRWSFAVVFCMGGGLLGWSFAWAVVFCGGKTTKDHRKRPPPMQKTTAKDHGHAPPLQKDHRHHKRPPPLEKTTAKDHRICQCIEAKTGALKNRRNAHTPDLDYSLLRPNAKIVR